MGIDYSPNKDLELQYAKTAINTTSGTAEQSLMSGAAVGSNVIPGGWFTPGASARIIIRGTLTTLLTPGTATFRIKLNGTTVGTGATTGLLSLASAAYFGVVVTIQCYDNSGTNNMGIGGQVQHPAGAAGQLGSAGINGVFSLDTSLPTTVDVTYQQTFGNTLTATISTLELLPK